MIDQQFFKELDEYLSSRPPKITLPPLELLNLKPIRRRYGYFGIIPGPSFGEVSLTPEEQHIRAFMEEFGKKKGKFKKTGTYLYDEFVWPALLKLDESGFETEGKRLFEEKNGTLCLKSSLFCRYADIDPKRISGLKSGSEPVTKETLLKLVIALKMDLKTAEEFMEAGGYPFDTVNDDQDAIIQFSIKYSARRGVPFSVKEYRHILKEGHLHAHYRGIYDKPRVKKRDNKAYAPAADSEAYELTPEYIEELATETKIIFKDGNMKPETRALKPSIEEINQKLINNYIIPFIKKKHAEGKNIGSKSAYHNGKPNITNFFEYAGIGQTTKDKILLYGKKNPEGVSQHTMFKLAIAMEMLLADAQAFLDETGESLKLHEPLDFVIICAMEYEQKKNYIFSPNGFRQILERCKNGYEFNYKSPYHDYE